MLFAPYNKSLNLCFLYNPLLAKVNYSVSSILYYREINFKFAPWESDLSWDNFAPGPIEDTCEQQAPLIWTLRQPTGTKTVPKGEWNEDSSNGRWNEDNSKCEVEQKTVPKWSDAHLISQGLV